MRKLMGLGNLLGCYSFLFLLGCGATDSVETDNIDDVDVSGWAATGHNTNNLVPGTALTKNQYLRSADGSHRLYMQGDGNLVLVRMSDLRPLWASGTNGKAAVSLGFQRDGNLVLRTASNAPVWASGTAGSNATELHLHSAGQLVLYRNSTAVWSANGAPPATDECPNDPNKTKPGLCGCGVPEGTCPGGSNPYCQGGVSGESTSQRATGSFTYGSQSVAYELRGGVIKTKHSPNACVETDVAPGQTQIVTLGTSDGGCTSCLVGQPVDRALMENQGFALIKVEGDQDARTEAWLRVFDAQNTKHHKRIALSGRSNAVAWAIAKVGVQLNAAKLASGVVSSGSGASLEHGQGNYGWLHMKQDSYNNKDYQRKALQFKFVAGFLDDTCVVIEEEQNAHMVSFWGQGDGDTFFAGIWGAGENVKDRILVERKEDWSFDVAIVAAGQNP